MSSPDALPTYWQSLALAADSGQLYLDGETAKACSAVCADYINKLTAHKSAAADLANIDGWGEFGAGRQLRDIYAERAVGGQNNMVDVLQSHIDVVEEMKVVFQKFFVETTDADETNAANVQSRGTR